MEGTGKMETTYINKSCDLSRVSLRTQTKGMLWMVAAATDDQCDLSHLNSLSIGCTVTYTACFASCFVTLRSLKFYRLDIESTIMKLKKMMD